MKPKVLKSWSLKIDYSRAFGADQKAHGLWERDCRKTEAGSQPCSQSLSSLPPLAVRLREAEKRDPGNEVAQIEAGSWSYDVIIEMIPRKKL